MNLLFSKKSYVDIFIGYQTYGFFREIFPNYLTCPKVYLIFFYSSTILGSVNLPRPRGKLTKSLQSAHIYARNSRRPHILTQMTIM